MPILQENKVILCDICKERPYKTTIELTRGNWVGVCNECNPKEKEVKDEKSI